MTTTTEAMNGLGSTSSSVSTPRSISTQSSKTKGKADPTERTITIDIDVAEDLASLASTHGCRIRDIVRVATILAHKHMRPPETKPDPVAWAERMAGGNGQ